MMRQCPYCETQTTEARCFVCHRPTNAMHGWIIGETFAEQVACLQPAPTDLVELENRLAALQVAGTLHHSRRVVSPPALPAGITMSEAVRCILDEAFHDDAAEQLQLDMMAFHYEQRMLIRDVYVPTGLIITSLLSGS